ncbi:hypothetical protein PV10_00238 [Exophiala mesophila]|uniref:DASH complex subunit DAM1 n=1 Tax=Exophiala mesophila TaxID=212818 RepID=A0A0D1ZNZ4_EXOME|nr:uncharacterized protein PV10_00238 [Exophiala mesophila]KIV96357.1 hypothetical protein PV10_00238 [Exophiala mesophila]
MARSPTSLSRPTTPLRPSSRSSFRASQQQSSSNALAGSYHDHSVLDVLEPQFAELADSMADLEANLMHLQLMHESLSRFSESFASFLYGLNMNAFVVDFPEAPIPESIARFQKRHRSGQATGAMDADDSVLGKLGRAPLDPDATIMMAGDTSSVSLKATPRRNTRNTPAVTPGTSSTLMGPPRSESSTRASGIARGRSTGAARGRGGSGLPRGRGRGVR